MPRILNTLRLQGFRSFRDFTLAGLTRVSLLVGSNNAGKTSILEGAEVLLGGGAPRVLVRGPMRRGEFVSGGEGVPTEADLSHLFHGHNPSAGAVFRLEGTNADARFVECRVADQRTLPLEGPEGEPELSLDIRTDDPSANVSLSLSPYGGLQREYQRRFAPSLPADAVTWVGTEDLSAQRLGATWDNIVLTPEEPKVIEALRIIQPDIERLAALTGEAGRSGSAIVVKLQGSNERLPLGSLGDGIKRLLMLSTSLVGSSGGYLMVDEIDTGLHYSVMVNMWKLLIESARRLDVQVFATTHSFDCVRALSYLYESAPDIQEDVSLHRVAQDAPSAVRYSVEEIHTAAQQHIEIR